MKAEPVETRHYPGNVLIPTGRVLTPTGIITCVNKLIGVIIELGNIAGIQPNLSNRVPIISWWTVNTDSSREPYLPDSACGSGRKRGREAFARQHPSGWLGQYTSF